MKTKIKKITYKIRHGIASYLSTNRLFVLFAIVSLAATISVRNFTIGNPWDYKPLLVDMALITIIGSLSYLIKPKKQFNYFFLWSLVITLMCIVNSIYYKFYLSFTSFSLLSTLGQVNDVTDSLVEKFQVIDFIYLLLPIVLIVFHYKLLKTNYYNMVSKIEKGKKMFSLTLMVGVILAAMTIVSLTATDYSRLSKQWNREYIVERFGIILYQGNDLIQSLTPKISSLFGYDEAAKLFREFYTDLWANNKPKANKYTGVLEGMNVVFVHMESIQTFLVGKQINGQELVPTTNTLIDEGLYFSSFYPQIGVGTSSDTEFTLLTSLMPALSGTVFVSYSNRDYVSLPKILKDNGYYTFSMHGNKADMWNRAIAHESLGYDEFYSKTSFNVTKENTVGLGIADHDFFSQAQPILENIENSYENYMGTLITLSNHSPFGGTEKGNKEIYNIYGTLDLTNTYEAIDEETGKKTTVVDPYLTETRLGNYLISSRYSDLALGDFINYIKNSAYYDNTVFVFYGDHDAKLSSSEYKYYYNYNQETGELYTAADPNYVDHNYFSHELNRSTPLIFWSKNKAVQKKLQAYNKGVNNNTIGMYDILPTLGNMMGFSNPYALGHDIFAAGEDNAVIFPNGNIVTNKIYYNNSTSSYIALNKKYYDKESRTYKYGSEKKSGNGYFSEVVEIDEDYITNLKEYVERRLDVSNAIIVHDLIKKEAAKITE